MKKIIFGLFLVGFIQSNFSQITSQDFESRILLQYRTLRIYVPHSYQNDSTKIYPLSIILDAEDLFDVYVANAKLLARKQEAPEQIIVGISQIETRIEDCTYDKNTSLPTSISADFKQFINLELLPYIDSKYRLSPFKVIVGRSLTANFINYFFIQKKPIFNAYININPSYAKGMASYIKDNIPSINLPIYYYMSSGSYNSKNKQAKIKGIYNLFDTFKNPFLNYKLDTFNGVTYSTSLGLSIPSALAYVYKLFGPITREEYNTKVSKMTPPEAIAFLEKKYVEIEYFFGTNVQIREKDILRIEPLIMDTADGDYLNEFGKMILRLYPNSPLGYYYIGQYYETGNFFKKAIKYYKIGYSKIDENDPNLDAFYINIERVMKKLKYGNGD